MDSCSTFQACTTYQILKDFAGPAAAIIGAIVAGIITFVISRGQKHIAKSQRDIALDQLKFSLLQEIRNISGDKGAA
jgi:Mn2+/Fe2+ NRAMP family transporter